jgi:phosphoribosylformylglycinamidine (FGAM) synthase PurS component
MAKEYREKVEKELREICYDVLVSTLIVLYDIDMLSYINAFLYIV